MPCFPTLLPGELLPILYSPLQGHLFREALPDATGPSPRGWRSMVTHTHTRSIPHTHRPSAHCRCGPREEPCRVSAAPVPVITILGTNAAVTSHPKLQRASWCRFWRLRLGYQSRPSNTLPGHPWHGHGAEGDSQCSKRRTERTARHAACPGKGGR